MSVDDKLARHWIMYSLLFIPSKAPTPGSRVFDVPPLKVLQERAQSVQCNVLHKALPSPALALHREIFQLRYLLLDQLTSLCYSFPFPLSPLVLLVN